MTNLPIQLRTDRRTWSDESVLRAWSVDRAETVAASPQFTSTDWRELVDESGAVDIAALAERIRDAVDRGEWSAVAAEDDDGPAARWWLAADESGIVSPLRRTDGRTDDPSLHNAGPSVEANTATHKRRTDGTVKGRQGARVGGRTGSTADGRPLDQVAATVAAQLDQAPTVVSINGTSRFEAKHGGRISAEALVKAADDIMTAADPDNVISLIGTDEYSWSEMTPALSGDVRIDIDGQDGPRRVLDGRRDVLEVLAARGVIGRTDLVDRLAVDKVIGDAMTHKVAHKRGTVPVPNRYTLDRRLVANLATRDDSFHVAVAGSLATLRVVSLPNAVRNGRTVIRFDSDGRRSIQTQQPRKVAAREAKREARGSDRRDQVAAQLADVMATGEGVVGDWRVMVLTPANPSRKVAAKLTAVHADGRTVEGAPRKLATLLAR